MAIDDEAAILCYGWNGTEWIPILVNAAGEVEIT